MTVFHQIGNGLDMTVSLQTEKSLEMTVSHQIEKSLEITVSYQIDIFFIGVVELEYFANSSLELSVCYGGDVSGLNLQSIPIQQNL